MCAVTAWCALIHSTHTHTLTHTHTQVQPGAHYQQQVGNSYTASLYMGLAGLWEAQVRKKAFKREASHYYKAFKRVAIIISSR